MSKLNSINTVRETFESVFDKVRFVPFIKNLLNGYEDAPITRTGQYIPDAYSDYVSKYERIGKYEDSDEKRIDILIVYLKKEASIERARSMQRNFIAGYLKGNYGTDSYKDAALVAFVSPNGEDWRFSLVKLEVKLDANADGQIKLTDEFTPAKRWSFLVGSHEKSHTAQRQFQPILEDIENNPTLEDLEGAFNIEKVTDEFFREYRRLFIEVKSALDKAVKANPKTKADFESKGIDTVNLAKKLLGQIIFLYYLQKKGWFGVPQDGKWGEGSKNFLRELFEKQHGDYEDFFNDVLEPLFYDALRIDRSDEDYYYKRFKCKIPFLNGGLFDPMGNYNWEKTVINLSNSLFSNKGMSLRGTKQSLGDGEIASGKGKSALAMTSEEGTGILDVFDLYNFTVNEDEPFEKEVAIDPELLGKAYEKFNAIRPDNYDEFLKALKSGKKGDESKFNKQYGVYYTPREIVHYMCQQSLINYLATEFVGADDHPPLISKDDLATLIQQGENLREHEARAESNPSRKYQPIISEEIREHAVMVDNKLAAIKVCDPAVGSGAFPVGMMSEIVRARDVLRTWTKTKKTVYDFKRQCIENSLYGVDIDAGAVEIAKLRLWLSLIVDEDDIQNIKPLPNLDYKIVCGNSLLGVEKNLFNVHLFTELETLKPLYFNATNPIKKQEYKKKIDSLIDQITDGREQFDFEIYFSEVFHEKSGFDVVIGNPPYLGERGNKDIFREIAQSEKGKRYYHRKMDLFYFFFHLALDLSKDGGYTSFITTNYFITSDGAKHLRMDFKARSSIIRLVNFNEVNIFDSAPGQHNMITLLQKIRGSDAVCESYTTRRSGWVSSSILQSIMNGVDELTDYSRIDQSSLYEGVNLYIRLSGSSKDSIDHTQVLLQKMQNNIKALGDICDISQGILTGVDKIANHHVVEGLIDAKYINHGVYVLDKNEIKQLNLSSKERDIIQPFFKNSDIQKYTSNLQPEKYVIYATRDLDINKYPNIKRHFDQFKKVIQARSADRGEMQAALKLGKWWVIFAARNLGVFLNKKIVCPQRSYQNAFAYNEVPWSGSADVYFMTERDKNIDLKYVLGLLNSKLYFLWLYHKGKRKGEMLELFYTPLTQIPIKPISLTEQKPFIKLVDGILAAKGGNPQADTSALEREIDQLVYELYELTEDEVKIVEGK